MSARALAVGAVLLWLALAVAPVRAHGGPPSYEEIVQDPRDPTQLLAATNFGMVASRDGGETWGWICPAAISLRSDIEDPLIAITSGGIRVAGDQAGLWVAGEDGCDWRSAHPMFDGRMIGAVASGGFRELWAATAAESRANEVFWSGDEGVTWTSRLGPTFDVWFESLAIAPTDPMRIYAMQHRPPLRTEPWEATFFRSDNGGAEWTSTPFSLIDREWRLYLLVVDPTNPDRILARTQNLYPDARERLMRSDDGGRTFTEVLQMRQIADATWSPDGASVWVGGPVDGLYRSDDGGRTFAPIQPSFQVRCTLARGGREVWVCGDDWANGFGIARSLDGGDTFEPMARLRSITGILACPAGSRVATVCPEQEPMLRSILDIAPGADAGTPDPDAGSGKGDAGPEKRDAEGGDLDADVERSDAGSMPSSRASCGCAAVRPQTPYRALAAIALVVLGRHALRRRKPAR